MPQAERNAAAISPVEQERIRRAARQLAASANFLRWAANFRQHEVRLHPTRERVYLLSALQSGRFSFATDGKTAYLGVQPFEAAWLSPMPLDVAVVEDRLFLSSKGVDCMGAKLLPTTIGIFVDDDAKLSQLRQCEHLQPIEVPVDAGKVVAVGDRIGVGCSISTSLALALKMAGGKSDSQDVARFF